MDPFVIGVLVCVAFNILWLIFFGKKEGGCNCKRNYVDVNTRSLQNQQLQTMRYFNDEVGFKRSPQDLHSSEQQDYRQ